MSLMDALFYWLQMRLLCESRPEDEAARETAAFFSQILSEDHGVAEHHVHSQDEGKIYVTYRSREATERTVWFDREAAEQLMNNPIMTRHEKEQTGTEEG